MSSGPVYYIEGCKLYLCQPQETSGDVTESEIANLRHNCHPYECKDDSSAPGGIKCQFSRSADIELSMTVNGSEYGVYNTIYQESITTYADLRDPAVGFIFNRYGADGGRTTKSLYPYDLEYYTANLRHCGDSGIISARFPNDPPMIKKSMIEPVIVKPEDMAIPVFTFSGAPDIAVRITAWLQAKQSTVLVPVKSVIIYHTEKMAAAANKLKESYLKRGIEADLHQVSADLYVTGNDEPDPAASKIRDQTLTVAYCPEPTSSLSDGARDEIYELALSESGYSSTQLESFEFTEEAVE